MKRCLYWVAAISLLLGAAGCAGFFSSAKPSPSVPYPQPRFLVDTAWLQERLAQKGLRIIDARNQGYDQGHVPGAIPISVQELKAGDTTLSLADLERILGGKGLQRDSPIVVYDDGPRSDGAAGWLFWLLSYLGCTDVRVVNGGWDRWTAEKQPVDRQPSSLPSVSFTAAPRKNLRMDTRQLGDLLEKGNILLIDNRTDEEFNGWALRGERRGGHIPDAVQLPVSWFWKTDRTVPDAEALQKLLAPRGITYDRPVVLYSDNGVRSGMAFLGLRLMGFNDVSVYEDFKNEWVTDSVKPMDKMARHEKLVNAQWVKDLIDGKNPATYGGKGYVILEVRYTGFSISVPGAAKEDGFIPGAVTIHPCYVEHGDNQAKYYPKYSSPQDGNLLPPTDIQEVLKKLGIDRDTTVVVYGNGKIIPMTSARVAWALMYAGVADVRILNGGFTSWLQAGFPVSGQPAVPQPKADFGLQVPGRPEFLATTGYIESTVKGQNSETLLLDVRKREEYDGKICPYPFFNKKGAIPGAVWMGDWDTLVDMNDNTFRSLAEVRRHWEKLGLSPGKEPVFYCGTGWRSSMGFFLAYVLGWDKTRNYDGSFYEWSWDPQRPLVLLKP